MKKRDIIGIMLKNKDRRRGGGQRKCLKKNKNKRMNGRKENVKRRRIGKGRNARKKKMAMGEMN